MERGDEDQNDETGIEKPTPVEPELSQ